MWYLKWNWLSKIDNQLRRKNDLKEMKNDNIIYSLMLYDNIKLVDWNVAWIPSRIILLKCCDIQMDNKLDFK